MEQPQQPAPPENIPEAQNPRVKLVTTLGDIVVELNPEAAPVTVRNFLRYVNEGFYDGIIFHRVIVDFMIQAGGFTADLEARLPHEPIINESDNGLKNVRGTIAMGRSPNEPDSATSLFYINRVNSPYLDHGSPNSADGYGYTVFGVVVEGMDVVDKIAESPVTDHDSYFKSLPVEPVVINKAVLIQERQ
ncbi:MAG: hypothetical protein AMJ79_05055 [Phycisphaerae bacterium SM23_30]|nr:MAG: hypothetical protein AMJ79_05055 [Phycisphaerae bacterium SM23_30]